jgi:hypothetical protein
MSVLLRRRRLIRPAQLQTATLSLAVVVPTLAAGYLSDAAPTGLREVDMAWVMALTAVVAWMTSTAKRWTWFLPAAAGAAMAGTTWAVAAAAVAIAVALFSVVTDTRSRARGALVGGLGMVALQGSSDIFFHGFTALVTFAAIVAPFASGYRYAGRRGQARIRQVAGWFGATCLVIVAGAVLGLVLTYQDLIDGVRGIDDGLAAAREADDDLASARLGEAVRHLRSADSTLSSFFVSPAEMLPILGPNIDAVGDLTHDAAEVAEYTADAADTADVDSLRFIDGRLDPRAVTQMKQPLLRSLESVEILSETLDAASHSPWLVAPLSDRVDLLRTQVDDALPDGHAAVNAIDHAPWLLGVDKPRTYLVLFVTPVEARGRTGFPGNFAELQVDNGKLSMPRFGRITELEEQGVPPDQRFLLQPQDYIDRYARFDPKGTWRNLTMSADFASTALVAQQLYPQSGGKPIDGVLSVDPEGLATLLRYTDPVDVEGLDEPISEDNAVEFLQREQYLEFTDRDERIDVLETVARTTFERLTVSDLPSPRALAEAFDPMVDGGHIQFTPYDVETFLWLDGLNVTGRMPDVTGDSLAVTTSNTGGSKIDLFLERSLRYDVTWDPATRALKGTVTVTLTNMSPTTGLPPDVIGNLVGAPSGTNQSFVSVYTPLTLDQARVDGQVRSFEPGVESERNVYSTTVQIAPGGTVVIELDVSGQVAGEGDDYVLDLLQQPLVNAEQAEVAVEVAGETPVEPSLSGPTEGSATLEGRTARWAGALDRRTTLTLTPED